MGTAAARRRAGLVYSLPSPGRHLGGGGGSPGASYALPAPSASVRGGPRPSSETQGNSAVHPVHGGHAAAAREVCSSALVGGIQGPAGTPQLREGGRQLPCLAPHGRIRNPRGGFGKAASSEGFKWRVSACWEGAERRHFLLKSKTYKSSFWSPKHAGCNSARGAGRGVYCSRIPAVSCASAKEHHW